MVDAEAASRFSSHLAAEDGAAGVAGAVVAADSVVAVVVVSVDSAVVGDRAVVAVVRVGNPEIAQ